SSDRRRQNSFAWPQTSQSKGHLRGEIRDWHTCGSHVVDIVRNQAKVFLPRGDPLAISSILKSTIGAKEHHARACGKVPSTSLFHHARSFVAQDQRRLRPVKFARENRMVQRRDAGRGDSYKHFSGCNRWLWKVCEFQPFITTKCFGSHCTHIISPCFRRSFRHPR